jgi:hypothetical protein
MNNHKDRELDAIIGKSVDRVLDQQEGKFVQDMLGEYLKEGDFCCIPSKQIGDIAVAEITKIEVGGVKRSLDIHTTAPTMMPTRIEFTIKIQMAAPPGQPILGLVKAAKKGGTI